jgi:hypothetical protein
VVKLRDSLSTLLNAPFIIAICLSIADSHVYQGSDHSTTRLKFTILASRTSRVTVAGEKFGKGALWREAPEL